MVDITKSVSGGSETDTDIAGIDGVSNWAKESITVVVDREVGPSLQEMAQRNGVEGRSFRNDGRSVGIEGEARGKQDVGELSGVVRGEDDDEKLGLQPASLDSLPDEIIFEILQYLDIPDLYALIKTTHHLRTLSLDPLLHRNRLRTARTTVNDSLLKRPSLHSLKFERRIYLSKGDLARRELNRSLTKIKLKRKLVNRPDPGLLVERGVLPQRYLRKEKKKKMFMIEGPGADDGFSRAQLPPPQPPHPAPNTLLATLPVPAPPPSSRDRARNRQPPSKIDTRHESQYPMYNFPPRIDPCLIGTCRSLEKQLIKFQLASYLSSKRLSIEDAKSRGLIRQDMLMPSWASPVSPSCLSEVEASRQTNTTNATAIRTTRRQRPTVRYLITRFTSRQDYDAFRKREIWEGRWGRSRAERAEKERGSSSGFGAWRGVSVGGGGRDPNPPRAKVLGLRRVYERLSRGG